MNTQFKNTVMDLSTHDNRTVMILGDVRAYFFYEFKEKYPDRFYNMGISENTLITVGAGLAAQKFYPFIYTIAPFITERSYEQIKLDMCYNQFGGNIVSCGATFDYTWDGPTHHAYTDLAILRLLPRMEVIQPGSTKEIDILLRSQYNNNNPTYVRLSDHSHHIDIPVKFGRGVVIRDNGAETTIMTAGPILGNVLEACKELPVNIVYFHTIKPIDTELIQRFRSTRILVVHDAFGLHEAICEVPGLQIFYHGIPDTFCTCYGSLQDLRRHLGLDPAGIREFVISKLKKAGDNLTCKI